MRGRFARHGLPAGLSAVLAVTAGALTNLATSGWSWPLVTGLVVLTGAYFGFEVWRAAGGEADRSLDEVVGAGTNREGPQRRSVAPPWGLLPVRVRGRDDHLADLAALVDAPDGRLHVLWGLGGCGKTTVALKAAERASSAHVAVWWISARDETSLTSGLMDLAVQLGASRDEVTEARIGIRSLTDLVWRHLESTSRRWLLVVDNADQPELLAAEGGRVRDGNGVVRGAGGGLVVVTSRVGGSDVWGSRAVLHPVASLSRHDGATVLLDVAGCGAGGDAEAAALAQRLGGLPLALRAAGRYLASTAARLDGITTFASYRQMLDARFAVLLGTDPVQAADPREAVMSTWELSLDLLVERGADQARAIMRLIGSLAPAPIPAALLDVDLLNRSPLFDSPLFDGGRSWARAISGVSRVRIRPWRRHGRYNAAAHRRVVAGLCDFGLLDRTTTTAGDLAVDCLGAHPLVVETNAATVRDDADLGRAVDATVAALLSAAARHHDPEDPVHAVWWSLLAPHVRLTLGRRVGGQRKRTRRALVGAGYTVSHGLHRGGDYLAAAALADTACRAAAEYLGADDPVTLTARYHRAHAHDHLGDYEPAADEYRQVLDAQRRVLGPGHLDTLRSQHDLAWLQAKLGRYCEAEREYREVLNARRRMLGSEHLETLRSHRNLACVLAFQNHYHEAETEFGHVLEMQLRVLGANHPDTVRTRHNHAHTLASQGSHQQAEAEYRVVLTARADLSGVDHVDTVRTRHDLAWVMALQGRYHEAETEYRAVLSVLRHRLGPDHIDTIRTRHDLATVAALQGRYDEAEAELPAVLTARQQILGVEHPATLRTRRNLAWLAARQGRHENAEAEYQAILEIQRRTLGTDNPETQLTDAHLRHLPHQQTPNAAGPPLWSGAITPDPVRLDRTGYGS